MQSEQLQTTNTTNSYYERRDFEDDDYAEMKRYHELIMLHSKSFYEKLDEFNARLESLEKELKVFELNKD